MLHEIVEQQAVCGEVASCEQQTSEHLKSKKKTTFFYAILNLRITNEIVVIID